MQPPFSSMPVAPAPSQALVLLGGGHTHALIVRMLAMAPLAGVSVTLVSDAAYAPYSGMVPGLVAGRYTYADAHIDLARLCLAAGVAFIQAQVGGLDLANRRVELVGRPALRYDLLSLNTGGVPQVEGTPGAAGRAVPVKPVPGFLAQWESLVALGAERAGRLVIVGAGLGGVELALAMRARLGRDASLTLVDASREVAPTVAPGARQTLLLRLRERGIHVELGQAVAAVADGAVHLVGGQSVPFDHLFWCTGVGGPAWLKGAGLRLDARGLIEVHATLAAVDHPGIFAAGDVAAVATQPRPRAGVFAVRQARPLLENLRRAARGAPLLPVRMQRRYLAIAGTADGSAIAMRGRWSATGPWAWALKDRIDRRFMARFDPRTWPAKGAATGGNEPERAGAAPAQPSAPAISAPAAGAGRQPPPSSSAAAGREPPPASGAAAGREPPPASGAAAGQEPPPSSSAAAGREPSPASGAAAGREPPPASGAAAGREPPPASNAGWQPAPAQPRCLGCGAKVGAAVLAAALSRIKAEAPPRRVDGLLLGTFDGEDAAAFTVPAGQVLLQSIDYLPALISDPFAFGRIAAAHALSDIYAMGGAPHSALALVNLPRAAPPLMEEQLYQLLAGVARTLQEAGAALIGGHTTEAPELAVGLAVNGLAAPAELWRKGGMQAGDALIVTKALGTGALFAAAMRGLATGASLAAATASMTQTNAAAAAVLKAYGASACTDVTGFGLIGHLAEMARAGAAAVELDLAAVPLLPGAARVAALGVRSSLFDANRAVASLTVAGAAAGRPELELLFDPQTSGGLVAAVPQNAAAACLAALRAAGCAAASRIGRVTAIKVEPWIHVS